MISKLIYLFIFCKFFAYSLQVFCKKAKIGYICKVFITKKIKKHEKNNKKSLSLSYKEAYAR